MKHAWKTLRNFFLLAIFAVPVIIDSPPRDTTQTNTAFWGSVGQYGLIARGCSGDVLRTKGIGYFDSGAKISAERKRVEIGIFAHAVRDRKEVEHEVHDPHEGYSWAYTYPHRTIFALNPFFEIKARYVGFGAGAFWSNTPLPKIDAKIFPSFHLRFGNLKSLYFDASFFQHPWLYSGDYWRIGLGSNKSPNFRPWVGVGFGPADKPGFIGRETFRLNDKLNLQVLARFGFSEGIPEPAIGLGMSYKK